MKNTTKIIGLLFGLAVYVQGTSLAQQREIPTELKPWVDWVTWDDALRSCPTPYNNANEHICFWPSSLSLSADSKLGKWSMTVTVFAETWLPLPGNGELWPANVLSDDTTVAVVERAGVPAVHLPAGLHQLSGEFLWDEMPQRIPVPKQIGVLSLAVEGSSVVNPSWDADGLVWLKRIRAEEADRDLLALQVYRVVEDGIPIWLRTEIELTVSGKSREEQLGWTLPEGWKLSLVESPIPVALDDQGRLKAQVRAGKWTVSLHAFRATDTREFQFAEGATPVSESELVAFQADPDLRIAEIEGIQMVDVTQTTFPSKWRNLPVYQWQTDTTFRLVEKMRGMGLQRPEGLSIDRRFWLDENGKGFTYRDKFSGKMQQLWRLDVAQGQKLGAVRVDGTGQLITVNPRSGADGIEIRDRNLNFEAIGRIESISPLSATGWQTNAESLSWTLTLPPGWRVFAVLGADRVEGDWLTAWSLLDLFLLLIFTVAVVRMFGIKAGVIAFLAFGLAYHEPGAPRLTWLFLLMPLALLRVVPQGIASRWVVAWKFLAVALLVLCLVPFVAMQIQSTLYPQLEMPGMNYGSGRLFSWSGFDSTRAGYDSMVQTSEYSSMESLSGFAVQSRGSFGVESKSATSGNMMYDVKARIQTGPAEPEWSWNEVFCKWNGPVTAEQQIRPILISLSMHRVLTILRVMLLMFLAAILLGSRRFGNPFSKRIGRRIATGIALMFALVPNLLLGQIPDKNMLDTLRKRVLDPSDAYPHAAEISTVDLKLNEGRLVMTANVHAAIDVAVPLPGRVPSWSPVSVKLDDDSDVPVCRKDDYLWVTVPKGVHRLVVEGMLSDSTEWEWTYLLKPRRVTITASEWNVIGISPSGVPEQQVFLSRLQETTVGEAAYDRTDFNAIVAIERQIEIGLIWKLHSRVRRLSSVNKAISLKVPLVAGESVLTSNMIVDAGMIDVRLGAGQLSFEWESELPVGQPLQLKATNTEQWVEQWQLVTSPVWNVAMSGPTPIFDSQEKRLIPIWHPWPAEQVDLTFSRPEAVTGETITVRHVEHRISLGSRQRTTTLKVDLECSLGGDFAIDLNPNAEISSLNLDSRAIPVRRNGAQLMVPVHPGKQIIEVAWRTNDKLQTVVSAESIRIPFDGSNVTTAIEVPESRWILWTSGPLRGPAVRFWTILICAILAAFSLGSTSMSPLSRLEWVLLALGLTQVHYIAAILVVVWLFLLAWRGTLTPDQTARWRFNLLQVGLVLLTFVALGILLVVVGEGLLGNPDMFITGNGSTRTYLQWFQSRIDLDLPKPIVVSVSVWFYRLLMLFWALWLAMALVRWLKWGWKQFSHGGYWKAEFKSSVPPMMASTN